MSLILTLNAGSSSIKFALYNKGNAGEQLAAGQVENLGAKAKLSLKRSNGETFSAAIGAASHKAALAAILAEKTALMPKGARIAGVGHRIVHGGSGFGEPQVLDGATIEKLQALCPLAPLHQPHNLAAVVAAKSSFPSALQIGCFDTAFHQGHAFIEETFALPRRYYEAGVRRYGFHGLSYQYVSGELARLYPELGKSRVVIAHLGNGASMCALSGGRSVSSTMGFSPLDGLAMGTRSGQIDPGVLLYMAQHEGLEPQAIADLLYKQSGLLGLSGVSHDMRTLEASSQPHAKQAIAYFIARIKRELGGLAAVLGGLDALVFCGGIGENSRMVRAGVCEAMEWLGISLDANANAANATDIGTGKVRVLVIPTDEERMIAQAVNARLG